MTTQAWLPREYSTAFPPDGHPSSYNPRPTGLNFGEETATEGSLSVQAVLLTKYQAGIFFFLLRYCRQKFIFTIKDLELIVADLALDLASLKDVLISDRLPLLSSCGTMVSQAVE